MRDILLLALAVLILYGLALNRKLSTYFDKCLPHEKIKPVTLTEQPTWEGYPGAPDRLYLILGGSGFVGSWFARYLLLRGESKVIVLDKRSPPADLVKHGAQWIKVDLTHILNVEEIFINIEGKYTDSNTKIVIYNCTCSRRYDEPRLAAFVDHGLRVAETLSGSVRRFRPQNTVVIHVGDSMSHRIPVSFWKFWNTNFWIQRSRLDTAPVVPWGLQKRSQAFSVYAWHQGAIESHIRLMSGATTGAIRSEGFLSGHYGDHLLSAAIQENRALLHTWNVPISLLHVEDFVRGGLALEHLLLDPETKDEYHRSVFTIAGDEPTTLNAIYDYITEKRKNFHVVAISPIVVYCLGWVFSILALFYQPPPDSSTDRSMLCGRPWTLTHARFATLQTGQLPNGHNSKRTAEILSLEPNFSTSQTIDGVIYDVNERMKRRRLSRSAAAGGRPNLK